MKVIYLVAGSGGSFYCGNCHRDRLYVSSLKKVEGVNATAVSLYLPPLGEDFGGEFENPVFFGAVSMFLRERIKMFEHMPSFLDKIFDAPPLLKLAAKKAGATRPEGFEETTLKMIKGYDPGRNKEITRLSRYISENGEPDIIHLANALIMGFAGQLKDATGAKIVCSLQNEDDWIEVMAEPYRSKAWELISEESRNIDLFISPSNYYKNFICEKTGIKEERIEVLPSGLEEKGFQNLSKITDVPTIGFYNRLSYLNGLDKIIDAYILIMKGNEVPSLQLHLCGGYTGDDKPFLKEQFRKLTESGFDQGVKLYLLRIEISQQNNPNNIGVSDIIGIVLVLLIIGGTVSTILFWGVPYMQDQKAFVAQENALLQFDAMGDLIEDAFAEGVFFYENEFANSSKTMTFKLSGGNLDLNNQGERFVIWYSFFDNFNFTVSDLEPDGNDNEITINIIDGSAQFLDVYYIYDDSLEDDENINIGDLTSHPLHDAVQINVTDGTYVVGRIWIFDVGSLTFRSNGPSKTYNAVVENGGVLATGDRTSGYFFNEPKFWSQTLLDNSSLLTLRIIQIKKDNGEGVDSIGGTSTSDVKFLIQPYYSIIRETKKPISGSLKMKIYGDSDAVSAWRYFYKNRLGFQGDEINEPLIWVPPTGASNVMFTLSHAVCDISMEV